MISGRVNGERRSQTIQAAVLRAALMPLAIESLELEGLREDEVLVRVVASGVCHTDIGLWETWSDSGSPVVLGHEGAGVVERVGKQVKTVREGEHVVLSYQSCGACPECLGRKPWACQRFYEANFGFARLDGSNALKQSGVRGHFFGQSSFATYSLATERSVVKVPEDLDLELLGPLGCGMQTGAGTVLNALAVHPNASIAILGTGSVGLAATMAARIAGANPIIGVDVNQHRLELALELGATDVIYSSQTDVASAVSRITGGGVDYTVDTTGDNSVLRLAVDLLNQGGTAALLTGAPSPSPLKGGRKTIQVIQGSSIPQEFIPRLIKYFRGGLFPFDRLVKFYDFADVNRAIADARDGRTIKPVLRISKSTR
jgi:aryl-alcohol dehydrogenase